MLITAFALSRILWLSYLLLFLDGAALLMVFSMTASLVQLIVPDHLRGRVVSIYMVAFRGGMPLGSLGAATPRRSARRPTSSPSTARWSRSWRCTSWCAATG